MFFKTVNYVFSFKGALLLLSIFTRILGDETYKKGNCTISTTSKEPICIGEVTCSETIKDIPNILETWDCNFNYDSFMLNLKVKDVEEDILNNEVEYDSDINDHILTITITCENKLKSAPLAIHELFNEIVDINLSSNAIEVLNLNAFATLVLLRKLNVSNNNIKELGGDDNIAMIIRPTYSILNTIDLSHNKIKRLNSNSFKQFPRLNYLNLSYNKISNLNNDVFAGLLYLQSLLLSHNQITHVGISFGPLINLKQLMLDHNDLPSLLDTYFPTLMILEKFNVSNNKLMHIDEFTFRNLSKLSEVDLSYNEKSFFPRLLFHNNLSRSIQVKY